MHRKGSLWTLFCALVFLSSFLSSFFTQFVSASCSSLLSLPPPPSLSLSLYPSFSICFLQSKQFHLRYGWLFNAVSPSELAEAWCSTCFSGAQMDFPKNTRTCSPTPCCTTPHQALSCLSEICHVFCHFPNTVIVYRFMEKHHDKVVVFLEVACSSFIIFILNNSICIKTVYD